VGGKLHFSVAEREGCYPIMKRYGFEINQPCVAECRVQLGRYVSERTLRTWRNELLSPKRSHHAKKSVQEAVNSVAGAPLLTEFDEPHGSIAEPSDLELDNLTDREKNAAI
jgi:hypothetical protein